MQNNLVYQNIVRTFASLKQGSRLVVNGLIRYFVGYKPNQYIRNFQQVRLHRLEFLFIGVRLFLFSTRSVRDAIIHLQSELKSSQGGGAYTIGCK